MPESLVFKVDDEVIKKFSRYRISEYITVKFFRESLYMLYYRIIYGCIVFRLASASLFKYFTDEVCKEDAF
ncbi:hypothetical protein HMPREF1214_02819 [Bacteroides sp. HPS0048]|nr:hypothetical protein HMPREF1214_02819 [Bacteroides sp. HPS0048]